jgi:hypothetical protein
MGEWAAVASTLIAGIGLLFAGWQLLAMNRSTAMERRVAIDGVVVSWRPVEAPRGPESDGSGVWLYEIRVHNPGRLPVDDVRIEWNFQCLVQRRRGGNLEPPTRLLELGTPVLPGGCEHVWSRRLVMNYAEAEAALPRTFAEVHFVDIDDNRRTNCWPRSLRSTTDVSAN